MVDRRPVKAYRHAAAAAPLLGSGNAARLLGRCNDAVHLLDNVLVLVGSRCGGQTGPTVLVDAVFVVVVLVIACTWVGWQARAVREDTDS